MSVTPIVSTNNVIIPSPFVTPRIESVHLPPLSITSSSSSDLPIPVAPASNIEGMINDSLLSANTFQPEAISVMYTLPSMNVHPMQTRSKSGIVKKKVCLTSIVSSPSVDLSLAEPVSYKKALKEPIWLLAMQEELAALHSQNTWSLVSLLADKNLVGCKWIFKLKQHADGTIARHKARLVAQGFSQEPGLDYGVKEPSHLKA